MLGRFMSHVRQQLVGYIALFIALGGVSYAQVRDNSVRAKHIATGAVGTLELRDRSVGLRDLAFPLDVVGETSSTKVTSTGQLQVLLRDTFRTTTRGGLTATAGLVAFGNQAGQVRVQVRVDGRPYGEIRQDVDVNEAQTIVYPHSIRPLRPGRHTLSLEAVAPAGGIVFEITSLVGYVTPSM